MNPIPEIEEEIEEIREKLNEVNREENGEIGEITKAILQKKIEFNRYVIKMLYLIMQIENTQESFV